MSAKLWLLGWAVVAVLAAACGDEESSGLQPTMTVSATSPTPLEPNRWGLFSLVGPGVDTTSSLPNFSSDAIDTGMITGPESPTRAAAIAPRFIDAPDEALGKLTSEGFEAAGASAQQGTSGTFASYVLYGRTTPSPAMFQVRAYTPTGPVAITRFPDNPVHDFRTSTAVRGHPTITKFPKPVTSDPNGQREVFWSQGGAVYFLTVTGPFTDDEVLGYASTISRKEGQP